MSSSGEQASSAVSFLDRMLARHGAEIAPAGPTGLNAGAVRKAMGQFTPLSRDEVKRAMARQVRKGSCGRGGLPDYVVATMYADYLLLNSLAKVAALYGRTRQSIYCIFSERGLALSAKKYLQKIEYRGRYFTPGKNGYYRATSGDRVQLHHKMWTDAFGPVPVGYQVTFKDADCTHLSLDNFACLPLREVTLFHHARHQLAKAS